MNGMFKPGLSLAAVIASALLLSASAKAETDCKSWLLGVCTSRYTEAEQAQINAQKWLEGVLRDPARSGPVLEQRLRKQVRYSNGLLLIEDPGLHGITTIPASSAWSVNCDEVTGVEVAWGSGDTAPVVELVPIGTKISRNACRELSQKVGDAVLRLTSGQ
jgi:hypothetical protein